MEENSRLSEEIRKLCPEIQEFAETLVHQVRDAAICDCDSLLSPNSKALAAKRWRQLGISEIEMAELIPDIVDCTVSSLLQAIDEGALKLKFTANNGRDIDLTEIGMGELLGWYVGTYGWREMFSKQRYVDDFEDLR